MSDDETVPLTKEDLEELGMTVECEHKHSDGASAWTVTDDAEGDCSERRLTRYFTTYSCTICGIEQEHKPEDFDDEQYYADLLDNYYDDMDIR